MVHKTILLCLQYFFFSAFGSSFIRNIETAEVVENTGIKPADLKKSVDAVKQYKADMIKAWNEYFDEN